MAHGWWQCSVHGEDVSLTGELPQPAEKKVADARRVIGTQDGNSPQTGRPEEASGGLASSELDLRKRYRNCHINYVQHNLPP